MSHLTRLFHHSRLPLALLLSAMVVFCFGLSILRVYFSDTKTYLFLNWNLFLACIPCIATTLAVVYPFLRQKKLLLAFVLVTWILFFPNAPYILTDLFHLKQRTGVPIWDDLVLILSFAWTGLMMGLISLMDIERLLLSNVKRIIAIPIIIILLFTGSFGIYIGRYLRWNSWDIVQEPFELLADIGDRFVNPFEHPRTWGVTILMGLLLNFIYWSVKEMNMKIYKPAQ